MHAKTFSLLNNHVNNANPMSFSLMEIKQKHYNKNDSLQGMFGSIFSKLFRAQGTVLVCCFPPVWLTHISSTRKGHTNSPGWEVNTIETRIKIKKYLKCIWHMKLYKPGGMSWSINLLISRLDGESLRLLCLHIRLATLRAQREKMSYSALLAAQQSWETW